MHQYADRCALTLATHDTSEPGETRTSVARAHLRDSIPSVSYKPRPRTTSRGDPMLEPNDFSESSWTGSGMMEPMYPPSPPPMPSPAPMMDEPEEAPRRKAPARKKKKAAKRRSEERRVGKECRAGGAQYT